MTPGLVQCFIKITRPLTFKNIIKQMDLLYVNFDAFCTIRFLCHDS